MRSFHFLCGAFAILAMVAPRCACAKAFPKLSGLGDMAKGSGLGDMAKGAASAASAVVPDGAAGALAGAAGAVGGAALASMTQVDTHQKALPQLYKSFGDAVDKLGDYGVISGTVTCASCLALNKPPYGASSWNNIWVSLSSGDNQACFRSTYKMKKIVGITNPGLCPTQLTANQQIRQLRDMEGIMAKMEKWNGTYRHRFSSMFIGTRGLDETNDVVAATISNCKNCLGFNKPDPNTGKIGIGLWNNVWNLARGICLPSRAVPVLGVTGITDVNNCGNPIPKIQGTEIGAEGKSKALGFLDGTGMLDLANTYDGGIKGPEAADCRACVQNNLPTPVGTEPRQDRYNLLWDIVLGECVPSSQAWRLGRNGVMNVNMCPTTEMEKFTMFYLARVQNNLKDAAMSPILQTCQGCTMMNRAPYIPGDANMAFLPNKKSGSTDSEGKIMRCVKSTEISHKREDYVIDPAICDCVDSLAAECKPFVSQFSCKALEENPLGGFRSLHGANASAGISANRADVSLLRSVAAVKRAAIGSEEAVNAEVELNQKIGEKQCMADQIGSIMGQMPKCVWQNFNKNDHGVKECQEGARKTMPDSANLNGLCQMFMAMKGVLSTNANSCSAAEKNQMAKINMNAAAAKVSIPKKEADHVFFRQLAGAVADKVAKTTSESNLAPAVSLSLLEETSHHILDTSKYHDAMVFTKENLWHLSPSEMPEFEAPKPNAFEELVSDVSSVHNAWKLKHRTELEDYRKANYHAY